MPYDRLDVVWENATEALSPLARTRIYTAHQRCWRTHALCQPDRHFRMDILGYHPADSAAVAETIPIRIGAVEFIETMG